YVGARSTHRRQNIRHFCQPCATGKQRLIARSGVLALKKPSRCSYYGTATFGQGSAAAIIEHGADCVAVVYHGHGPPHPPRQRGTPSPRRLKEILASLRHDVVRVEDEHLLAQPDTVLAAAARKENRVLFAI